MLPKERKQRQSKDFFDHFWIAAFLLTEDKKMFFHTAQGRIAIRPCRKCRHVWIFFSKNNFLLIFNRDLQLHYLIII